MARRFRGINEVEAPDWLPTHDALADGDRVVHGDLHPMNVILGRSAALATGTSSMPVSTTPAASGSSMPT